MKETISSLDLYHMVKEFQDLEGARLDKVYHQKDELVLQFFSTATKKVFMFFKLPSTLFLTTKKPNASEPTGFAMFLRKKIQMKRVEKIEQLSFERVIKISFDEYDLYSELFAPGNFILTDKENKIISMQNSLNTKDRTVRGGITYDPLIREFSPYMDLREFFSQTDKESVVKALAIDLGFGGTYAEEICKRAKIDKDLETPDQKQIESIRKAIDEMLENNPSKKDDEIFPVMMQGAEPIDQKFSLAIGEVLQEKFIIQEEKEIVSSHEKKRKKIESIIDKQKKQIESLEKDVDTEQKKGELIYQNYAQIQDILKTINDAKKKYSYKEIEKILKDKNIIKELNEKEQSVVVEL